MYVRPTPAELREIVARAQALAAEIDHMAARLREAPDRPTKDVVFRMDDAAGEARRAGAAIEATASDLVRVINRGTCGAEWGVCPEHGNTLTSTGGKSWCRDPLCGRRWDYDRAGLPCGEPATSRATNTAGENEILLCTGHTIDARKRITDIVITPLTSAE